MTCTCVYTFVRIDLLTHWLCLETRCHLSLQFVSSLHLPFHLYLCLHVYLNILLYIGLLHTAWTFDYKIDLYACLIWQPWFMLVIVCTITLMFTLILVFGIKTFAHTSTYTFTYTVGLRVRWLKRALVCGRVHVSASAILHIWLRIWRPTRIFIIIIIRTI